jgi:hypothetical protein
MNWGEVLEGLQVLAKQMLRIISSSVKEKFAMGTEPQPVGIGKVL